MFSFTVFYYFLKKKEAATVLRVHSSGNNYKGDLPNSKIWAWLKYWNKVFAVTNILEKLQRCHRKPMAGRIPTNHQKGGFWMSQLEWFHSMRQGRMMKKYKDTHPFFMFSSSCSGLWGGWSRSKLAPGPTAGREAHMNILIWTTVQ